MGEIRRLGRCDPNEGMIGRAQHQGGNRFFRSIADFDLGDETCLIKLESRRGEGLDLDIDCYGVDG